MQQRTYWLDLFTGSTWEEFHEAGAKVSGFREGRWKTVQQIKVGDYLLCYLTGLSRFIGILEVKKAPYKDRSPIWKEDPFPCRVGVRVVEALTPETAVPILELRSDLSIFDPQKPAYWTGFVRGSPARWKTADGEAVVRAVLQAKMAPVPRPYDRKKLSGPPLPLKSKVGPVTVPGAEQSTVTEPLAVTEVTAHSEIQWTLAKLGGDMGLDVWVARNDRNREVKGQKIGDLPRLKAELPLQFDDATNKTIELIDVLWLQKHSIVAAFEIESTTSIYSGLLRLSDLISMQPN